MSIPKVSIQGFRGSFSNIVVAKLFPEHDLLEHPAFSDIFKDLAEGKSDFGVMPIENSIAGAILENYDRLKNSGVWIVGEYYLRIEHQLMAMPGQTLDDLDEVWSHPMALKQCQNFLSTHTHLRSVEMEDTAGSAEQIAENKLMGVAAIASELAAEIHGLEILQRNVESDAENYTRFVVITEGGVSREEGRAVVVGNRADKASIYVETAHKPGGLLAVLQVLRDHDCNMTMLVSRPVVGKAWEYGFYIDFEFTKEFEQIKSSIVEQADLVKVLGVYEGFGERTE